MVEGQGMGFSSNEPPKGFYVSNRNLPEKDRTENWREAVSPLYEALEAPVEGATSIEGAIHSLLLGERVIMFAAFGGHRCVRTREWIKRSTYDYYYVQLCVSGLCFGSFEGREISLSPGDIHIGSVTAVFDAACSNSTATLSLMLDKDELEYICGVSNLNGKVIRGNTALGELLGMLFRGSYREAGDLSFKEGAACGDVLLHLLASAVKYDHDNIRSAPSEQLRNQVLQFINRNINDPKLDVDLILERFSISRSHLYRLLEADGGAAGLIRKKRLQLARNELIRRKEDEGLRIKAVANKYGFSNTGRFARSFQHQFSLSPSEFLKKQSEDEALAGQIIRLHGHYGNLKDRWNMNAVG
ncbi:hypothetical protein Brsp07_00959 [Brucella sp. NBRC 14130]|nr:helix-turn-helix domain-containing protein [Brucella intermedia]KAB2712255.1 helix-turn-helix domain-containing protein [Brucella intermedia]